MKRYSEHARAVSTLPALPACLPAIHGTAVCLFVCLSKRRPSVRPPPSICLCVCLPASVSQSVHRPVRRRPSPSVRPSSPAPHQNHHHHHKPPPFTNQFTALPYYFHFVQPSCIHCFTPSTHAVVRRPSSIVRPSVGRPQRIVSPKAKSASPNDIHAQD